MSDSGGDCCHDLGRILDEDNIVLRDPADPYVPGIVRSDGNDPARWFHIPAGGGGDPPPPQRQSEIAASRFVPSGPGANENNHGSHFDEAGNGDCRFASAIIPRRDRRSAFRVGLFLSQARWGF